MSADIERCDFLFVHEELVGRLLRSLPPDEQLYGLSELFKVFGDSTRIKILYALLDAELCVCDIARLLSITPTAASHQLRELKNSLLGKSRREGKVVFYSLCDDHVRGILHMGMEHIKE